MKVVLDYPDLSLFMKEVIGLAGTIHVAVEQLEKKCDSDNCEISESASLLLKMIKNLDEKIIDQESLKQMN